MFPSPSRWLGSAPWSRSSCTRNGKTQEELLGASVSSTLSPALTRLRRLQAGITERQHSSLCGFRCLLAHEAHRQGADGQELRMLGAGGGSPGSAGITGLRFWELKKVLPTAVAASEGSPGPFLLLPQPSTTVGIRPIENTENPFRKSLWATSGVGCDATRLANYPDRRAGRLAHTRPA